MRRSSKSKENRTPFKRLIFYCEYPSLESRQTFPHRLIHPQFQTQEKKLIAEIKKSAKQGQMVFFTKLHLKKQT
ncbi:hypothetical protein V6N11_017699 [Hibiscus sabdariffa]|uniref:Ribosomal protein S10 n=1 Tax=Hibiscus sabdariffa TaxID=183260 RepID=A0ABR2TZ25_9ROSI